MPEDTYPLDVYIRWGDMRDTVGPLRVTLGAGEYGKSFRMTHLPSGRMLAVYTYMHHKAFEYLIRHYARHAYRFFSKYQT